MPAQLIRTTLAANERANNPLANWDYQYAPYDALVRLGAHCTGAAGGQQWRIKTGSDEVLSVSAIPVGATDGAFPAPLSVPYIEFRVTSGDRITIAYDELGGVATTDIMLAIFIDPI